MKKILFVLMLVLALSACAFGDTYVFQYDFSTGVEGWNLVEWDIANERAISADNFEAYYNLSVFTPTRIGLYHMI